MAQGKEGTLYMMSDSGASISVASSEADVRVWHRRLKHTSENRMKVMLSKDKMSGLKSVELDFCEDCVYEKQKRVSFSTMRKDSESREVRVGAYRCLM